jgi:hypothetical protein
MDAHRLRARPVVLDHWGLRLHPGSRDFFAPQGNVGATIMIDLRGRADTCTGPDRRCGPARLDLGEWGSSRLVATAAGGPFDQGKLRAGPLLEKVLSPSCAQVASIGNGRANAISENEPNYEPDCESNRDVWHHRGNIWS